MAVLGGKRTPALLPDCALCAWNSVLPFSCSPLLSQLRQLGTTACTRLVRHGLHSARGLLQPDPRCIRRPLDQACPSCCRASEPSVSPPRVLHEETVRGADATITGRCFVLQGVTSWRILDLVLCLSREERGGSMVGAGRSASCTGMSGLQMSAKVAPLLPAAASA